MKITQLRFKNLNALYGEWSIDFSVPEYRNNGLFSITGPTGAGKSTVLDAICLAFYGATPRLGKISSSGNEIMSKGTAICYSEVLFETSQGTYRCFWSQHRSHGKATGRLNDTRHEVSDGITGQVIESKKRDVANWVEVHTGLDFERFTRSILLAQGSFAAFLQASPDERAPILEQITGTAIYSDISIRTHQMYKEEQSNLEYLKAGLETISALEDEEREELEKELTEISLEEARCHQDRLQKQKSVLWLEGLEAKQSSILRLQEQMSQIQTELDLFQDDRDSLNRALKAAEFENDFALLSVARKAQQEDSAELVSCDQKAEELLQAKKKAKEAHHQAEIQWQSYRQAAQEGLKNVSVLRGLDQEILQLEEEQKQQENEKLILRESLEGRKRAIDGHNGKKVRLEKDLLASRSYLENHHQDEFLLTHYQTVLYQLNNLRELEKKRRTLEPKLVESIERRALTQKEKTKAEKGLEDLKQQIMGISKMIEGQQKDLEKNLGGRTEEDIQRELDDLYYQRQLESKITDLESERSHLQSGQPCPLCGSVSHPFVEGQEPVIHATDERIKGIKTIIKNVVGTKQRIQELRDRNTEIQRNNDRVLADLGGLGGRIDSLSNEVERVQEEIEQIRGEESNLSNDLTTTLKPLGISIGPEISIQELADRLNLRREAFQKHRDQMAQLERDVLTLETQIKQDQGFLDALNHQYAVIEVKLEAHKSQVLGKKEKRVAQFGDQKPDEMETRIAEQSVYKEEKVKTTRITLEQHQEDWTRLETKMATLRDQIAQRESDLERREQEFLEQIKANGFKSEEGFHRARLPKDVRKAQAEKAQELDERKSFNQNQIKEKKEEFEAEQKKALTSMDMPTLAEQIRGLDQHLKGLSEKSGAIKQKLQVDQEARLTIGNKQREIQVQARKCDTWKQLHSLIGSADGKKFRNFAQGLTFERVIQHANIQLRKMTDRYVLWRTPEEPLQLSVVDQYQAGEIRSAQNLSGGESFMVSLALALGLSRMASRKVKVDSLFLDEGFGTLDEDALEQALQALSGLHQEGKLIGVISHVAAIRERLTTQIRVHTLVGGRSRIEGPGCKKL